MRELDKKKDFAYWKKLYDSGSLVEFNTNLDGQL